MATIKKYKNTSEEQILSMYIKDNKTIRQIYDENHAPMHKIRRILKSNNATRTAKECAAISFMLGRRTMPKQTKEQNIESLKKAYGVRCKKGFNGKYFKDGYIVLNSGKREHVKIIEDHIGRYLVKGEVVHHINGNRADNRLENLLLMTNVIHATYHRMMECNITIQDIIEIIESTESSKTLTLKYGLERHRVTNMRKNKERYYLLKNYLENEHKQSYHLGLCR